MEIYLDNSATTKCSDRVIEVATKAMTQVYGNPSSLHNMGMNAENMIKKAKEQIAKTLRCSEKEILFTSCGTESNNLAIKGGVYGNPRVGKHIITTAVEHAAVSSTMAHLEEQGYEVTYLPVNKEGYISLEDLKNAMREDTVMVAIMMVNNEVGARMPVEEAGKLIKECNPKTLFFVDAIQGYGKYRINPTAAKIDLLSVSGHKIHAPKGVAFLYMKQGTKLATQLHGGGHQNNIRSGTENVPGIAALGQAAEDIYTDLDAKVDKMYELREFFIQEALNIGGIQINGRHTRDNAPHIISMSVPGVRSEVLLHALEERNIYVSAGSACSSNKPAISATLKAMGLSKDCLESTVRISMCEYTTKEELAELLDTLKELLPMLLRYTRR